MFERLNGEPIPITKSDSWREVDNTRIESLTHIITYMFLSVYLRFPRQSNMVWSKLTNTYTYDATVGWLEIILFINMNWRMQKPASSNPQRNRLKEIWKIEAWRKHGLQSRQIQHTYYYIFYQLFKHISTIDRS